MLLLGPSGSGKSDLLLRLLDRGFSLVADDRVMVEAGMAAPAPGLEGLIEVRGLGILRQPYEAPVRLALALELSSEVPERLPSRLARQLYELPLLGLNPWSASAPALVAHALACLRDPRLMHTGAFS